MTKEILVAIFWVLFYLFCMVMFLKASIFDENVCQSIFWGVLSVTNQINLKTHID